MASFWAKKLMEKMKFTDYWKVLVLNFSVVENTVFFWVKKLMERWYLLVTEKFLFWTFRWWEIPSFFQQKSWCKDDIYLVFLSFRWYSRTWEIRFFVQRQNCIFSQFVCVFIYTVVSLRQSGKYILYTLNTLHDYLVLDCSYLIFSPIGSGFSVN